MKRENRKYWISPALLILLLLAGAWYFRPISIMELYPDLNPSGITVLISRSTGNGIQDAAFDLDSDSPEYQEILSQMNDLSIHRPPTNLLLHFLPSSGDGRELTEGSYNYVVHLWDSQNQGYAALQFFIDSWEYSTPDTTQYLPCFIKNGAAAGQSLGSKLWELAHSLDSVL